MFVDPAWRGMGVGRALLSALIDGAKARGYAMLRLGTLHDMDAALGLYRSMGFQPIARYRDDELIDTRFFELALQGVAAGERSDVEASARTPSPPSVL